VPQIDRQRDHVDRLNSDQLADLLGELGVAYIRHDHAAARTCEDVSAVLAHAPGARTKNLFLRDKRGRRHFLLVTVCERKVDIKRVAELVGADNLSFASPERLARYLGVTPGAVTLLGLVNDRDRAVELLIDRDVWESTCVHCHPLVNTATLVIKHAGIERFLEFTGHSPSVISLS
jgi:Ala-tRNA(Pro) deacylase